MQTHSCACVSILGLCTHRFHLTYACKILRTQGPSCACMALGRNPSLGILDLFFLSFFHFFAILTSCFTIFCTQLRIPCHISSYCESNITFPPFFSPSHEFNPILFLQVSALYSGKGSTSRDLVWHNILPKETHCIVGFEVVIHLMPERSTSAVLV